MASKLHTPLCDMLGIEYPIILAGMGSATPPRLVAAVSNAGGLGVMGYGAKTPEEFDGWIKEVRRLTDRPFGVDYLIPALMAEVQQQTKGEVRAMIAREYPQHAAFVQDLMRQFDLPDVEIPDEPPESAATIRRKVEVMLDNNVPVFACAVGEPPAWVMDACHAQGTKVIGMVGAVRHAYRHLKAGSDIICAQGTEAGGHSGNIATFVLVPQVVDVVKPTPVVAAGGMGSGRQVAAAMALGAQGVWAGTAFLAAEEQSIPALHQEHIITGRSEDFTLSKYDSGKQARDYRSPVKEAWEKSGLQVLPYPYNGIMWEPLKASARKMGRFDLLPNFGGQVAGMITRRRPAREIFDDMVNEAIETIERLRSSVE